MIDPDDENVVAANAAKTMRPSRAPLWVGLSIALAASPMLCQLVDWNRQEELARTGTAAKAHVTEIRPTGSYHNDQPEVRLSVEVQPPSSKAYPATIVTVLSPIYLPRFQPGAVVDVRFDPAKPSDVVLVGP